MPAKYRTSLFSAFVSNNVGLDFIAVSSPTSYWISHLSKDSYSRLPAQLRKIFTSLPSSSTRSSLLFLLVLMPGVGCDPQFSMPST